MTTEVITNHVVRAAIEALQKGKKRLGDLFSQKVLNSWTTVNLEASKSLRTRR